jgi:hypothetical protein
VALKLIGAGLGRTGTLSIKLALEQIGFGPCYHMAEVLMKPSRGAGWVQAANGEADWEAIFEGYVASVDYPGCTFWKELAGYYPAAKVLLSVRDPQQWFESTQQTIFSEANKARLMPTPMAEFFSKTVFGTVGERIHDRDFMIDLFKRHNAEVQRSIPADRLLVYEVAQGWAPLCRFLGVPVPDTAFPRVNTRDEFGGGMKEAEAHNRGGKGVDPEAMGELVRQRLENLRKKGSAG